jgi:hypothetical protein
MLDTQQYSTDLRDKYPHMFPLDKEVWNRFLAKYGSMYTGVQYDITCGITTELHPSVVGNYAKDAQILSKLRIDAVGESPEYIDIIEVKPRGNMGAIGQLLTYQRHYIKEYQPVKKVRMVLVCAEIDPNIVELATESGIVYIVV